MTALTTFKNILFTAALVWQTQALAAARCHSLFQTLPTTKIKSETQILHEKDPRLHLSPWVEHTSKKYKQKYGSTLIKPTDKLDQFLDYLTKVSEKSATSPRTLDQLKTILNNHYVIKFEEIPETYYESQIRLARERGHGNITLSKEQKTQLAETIIADQKKSLEAWTEYFVSKDTSMYPMWIKFWMFTGMTKLSKYDPQNGKFGHRDKGTVAPFPEINREALGLAVDMVLKYFNKNTLEDLNDPELIKTIPTLNFGKIYAQLLFKLGVGKEGSFKTNEGTWVLYPQGSDHRPLVQSLEGKNTGWCTAGESTAESQLKNGDFYVYYSLDSNGKPSLPRVAIRMQGTEIAEVRGVARNQNLDPQINQSPIVSAKLKEFGSQGERFQKKDRDMKMLTQIEGKHTAKLALTKEELRFLYEVDAKIEGFGYESDPRIKEIKSHRDAKSDLVTAFDKKYSQDEISLTNEEALSGRSKIHFGDLWITTFDSIKGLKLPETINGNLILESLSLAHELKLPSTINGNLELRSLTSAHGLKLPDTINGNLEFRSLTSAHGLKLPDTINGSLFLNSLTSAHGLKLPDTVNGSLFLNSLTSAQGLKLPDTINGSLDLRSLTSAQGLKLPDTINGSLFLNSLTSAQGLKLPDTVNGYLVLNSLTSAQGLKLPRGVIEYVGPNDF